MTRFTIVEIDEPQIGSCVIMAFRYMVEDVETGARWFGSNSYQECLDYIQNHTQTNVN